MRHLGLDKVLEVQGSSADKGRCRHLSGLAMSNVKAAQTAITSDPSLDPTAEYVVDVDCSAKFRGRPSACSPCLIRSRPRGFWLLKRRGRLTAAEASRLQGLGSDHLTNHLSDAALRSACGNAMSICVLTRVLAKLLPCAGLSAAIVDP